MSEQKTYFKIWLGGFLLPQTPGSISGQISSGNESWRSAKGYEYTKPKPAGKEEMTMDIYITKDYYPYQWSEEDGANPDWTGESGAMEFKSFLVDAMNSCEPIEMIIERDPDGRESEEGEYYVNDVSWVEDNENLNDFIFTVTFVNADPRPLNQETSESLQHHLVKAREKEGWKAGRGRTGEENSSTPNKNSTSKSSSGGKS